MMDTITKEVRSRNMAAIKGKNTKPELFVRRLLYSNGYRYRLHRNNLPGKPDILLKKHNTVIFVHGCFWHQHPGCKYASKPKSNIKFWRKKLGLNVKRDGENIRKLKEIGYNVLIIWECETDNKNKDELMNKITRVLHG